MSITVLLVLTSLSGCNEKLVRVKNKIPRLTAKKVHITVSKKFIVKKHNVMYPIQEFKELFKQIALANGGNDFMVEEIIEFNRRFTTKEKDKK